MQKRAIIISNSLTNDFLSPKEKFLKVDINVGLREINRLMGEGERYSQGPLPVYLHEALTAMQEGLQIMHILVEIYTIPMIRSNNRNSCVSEATIFWAPRVRNSWRRSKALFLIRPSLIRTHWPCLFIPSTLPCTHSSAKIF